MTCQTLSPLDNPFQISHVLLQRRRGLPNQHSAPMLIPDCLKVFWSMPGAHTRCCAGEKIYWIGMLLISLHGVKCQ